MSRSKLKTRRHTASAAQYAGPQSRALIWSRTSSDQLRTTITIHSHPAAVSSPNSMTSSLPTTFLTGFVRPASRLPIEQAQQTDEHRLDANADAPKNHEHGKKKRIVTCSSMTVTFILLKVLKSLSICSIRSPGCNEPENKTPLIPSQVLDEDIPPRMLVAIAAEAAARTREGLRAPEIVVYATACTASL